MKRLPVLLLLSLLLIGGLKAADVDENVNPEDEEAGDFFPEGAEDSFEEPSGEQLDMPEPVIRKKMAEIFKLIDVDDSKSVTHAEVESWLKVLDGIRRKHRLLEEFSTLVAEEEAKPDSGEAASLRQTLEAAKGDVSMDELETLMKRSPAMKTYLEKEVKEILNTYDADHSGHISFDEFVKAMQAQMPPEGPPEKEGGEAALSAEQMESLSKPFQEVDSNGDGVIDTAELTTVWEKDFLGASATAEELNGQITSVFNSPNADASMSLEDFMGSRMVELANSVLTDSGHMLAFPGEYKELHLSVEPEEAEEPAAPPSKDEL